jgi:cell wall-associated NlpC family hydrolase
MSPRYGPYTRRLLRRRARKLAVRYLWVPAAAGLVLVLVVHPSDGHTTAASTTSAAPGSAAAQAIAFATAREGCPYVYAGTGPCQDGYDCSGLVMEAYAAAGISLPRTSQEMWAAGPQVSTPQPGDLVFFAGADGTATSPGHVGLVTGSHTMIDAYATGYDVQQQSFGLPSSWGGLQQVVGYTDPAARGSS